MINKWKGIFEGLGFKVSKWRLPKGAKGTIYPAPYIVLQKNLDNVSWADNKPYKVCEEITAILVMSADDEESEKTVVDYLLGNCIGIKRDENLWDYDMNVHVRILTFADVEHYDPERSY